MLKKILAMLLAFVMMLSLTACGVNKPAEPDDDENRQERVTEEPKKTEGYQNGGNEGTQKSRRKQRNRKRRRNLRKPKSPPKNPPKNPKRSVQIFETLWMNTKNSSTNM